MRVRISRSNRIAIPAAVLKKLQTRSGDHLLVEVRGAHLILMPEPPDYPKHLRGLHQKVWEGVDPQEYLHRERESWQE